MANFFVKTVTGSMLYQPVSQWHSLHFELLIELVAQKLTELWRFKNLAYFLTWWPSSMTYLFVNVTYWNSSPIPYVDQVWWWYVKAFMSYAWQNWQTNRQTDRQTDRQMKGQSEIAYLPKFANMMLIVMVIVITEILYIILIFDCFENQYDCIYWLMMLMLLPLYTHSTCLVTWWPSY